MKGFKVRIVISELLGDNFKSLIDYDESCKLEDLKSTLNRLTKSIKTFIERNNISEEDNDNKGSS